MLRRQVLPLFDSQFKGCRANSPSGLSGPLATFVSLVPFHLLAFTWQH
jgi:hypothetical protein